MKRAAASTIVQSTWKKLRIFKIKYKA
jgi:hypothetical protein